MFSISEELKKLPDLPGVYLMYDENDQLIYVGKAISLRKRVRQYFNNDKNKHPKVVVLVENIVRFEYILVDNEVEALVLESNLIKKNRPKYNVLMRDDKQYPYIKIVKEKFPRVVKVRRVEKDGGVYFGPYPNAYAVNDILDLLNQVYRLRTCNLNFDKGRQLSRPCLNYFIEKCAGPCIGKADEEKYMENIGLVEEFLKGKQNILIDRLTREMNRASEAQNYEQAALHRDRILSVETIMEKQKISSPGQLDIDFVALARGRKYDCIQVFFMRNGKVVDREHFIMQNDYREEPEEVLTSFLNQFYIDNTYVPKEINVECIPEDADVLAEYLRQAKGSKVHIRVPKRGDKRALLDMVKNNAREMLEKYERRYIKRERIPVEGLLELENLLGINDLWRIEAYDISHIAGSQSVGSMVTYLDGRKAPKEYRKFKIKSAEGGDDYAGHREILRRRFERGLREREAGNVQGGFGQFPKLILIDGGKGHVRAAEEVLDLLEIRIPVCGLVKDDKHKTRGIIFNDKEISPDARSPAFKLVYAIQEEVHRFAIEYHKKLRKISMVESVLDSIPKVGPVRRKALLQHFSSVKKIKEASLEELAEVPGLPRTVAAEIYHFFRKESAE